MKTINKKSTLYIGVLSLSAFVIFASFQQTYLVDVRAQPQETGAAVRTHSNYENFTVAYGQCFCDPSDGDYKLGDPIGNRKDHYFFSNITNLSDEEIKVRWSKYLKRTYPFFVTGYLNTMDKKLLNAPYLYPRDAKNVVEKYKQDLKESREANDWVIVEVDLTNE